MRASSAAPYYLDDFLTADGKRFQDGATTANNPTVVALQQARLLHPQLPVDCVVSLGCGSEPRTDRSKGLSAVREVLLVLPTLRHVIDASTQPHGSTPLMSVLSSPHLCCCAQVIDTGAVLLESATSTDRVHEALATTLQLVPGCQYFRCGRLMEGGCWEGSTKGAEACWLAGGSRHMHPGFQTGSSMRVCVCLFCAC